MQADFFEAREIAGREGAAKSVAALGIAQALRVIVGFVSIVTVSRLLSPDDYGLYAMALPILGLAVLFQDLGISQVTVQAREMDHERASALFWLAIAAGGAASAGVFLSAWPAALFFGRPEIIDILHACSLLPVLGALQTQHSALVTRQMRFRSIASVEIAGLVVGFSIALAGAIVWRSYWALVVSSIAAAIVGLLGTWRICPWRPGLPRLSDLSGLVRFGAGVSAFNVLNFITRNADNVIVGRFLGVGALGLYDRAYRLLMFPIQQVNAPIGRVMIPALSRLADQPERYRKVYGEATGLILILTQPAILTATILAGPVIDLALGSQWSGVAPIFAWLGLCSLHQVYTGTIGWLLLSQGRGSDLVRVSGFSAVTAIAAFAAGLPWGPVGVAAAYTITDWLVRLPVLWWIAGRHGPVNLSDLGKGFLPHAVSTTCCAGVLLAINISMPLRGAWELLLALFCVQMAHVAIVMLFPAQRALVLRYAGIGLCRLQSFRAAVSAAR